MLALFFEVMDKMPELWDIWQYCIPIALIGFFLCWYRWWFIPLPFLLAFPLLFYALPEIEDPMLRNAIIQEAGWSYYLIRFSGVFFALALPSLGTLLHVKNYKKQPTQ